MSSPLPNVSRAQRSAERCAVDPGLRFLFAKQPGSRISGAPLCAAPHPGHTVAIYPATSFDEALSSNTLISGALPEKPSSFQRAATWSYIVLSSLVRGENVLMC